MDENEGQGLEEGTATSERQESFSEQESASSDSLADGFLKNVQEDHRPIVEQYIRDWDSGVTKRFQEIHSQYEPYKAFQEQGIQPEQLGLAIDVLQTLDSNPKQIYDLLGSMLEEELKAEQGQSNGQGNQEPGEEWLADLPPQFVQQFKQQGELLEALSQFIVTQHQSVELEQQQAAEDQALDEFLSSMKEKYGEFDEGYVLALMGAGIDGEQAIKQFQSLTQNIIGQREASGNGPSAKVPPIIPPGGNLGSDAKDIASADSKETRNFVAELLRSANQG